MNNIKNDTKNIQNNGHKTTENNANSLTYFERQVIELLKKIYENTEKNLNNK